MILACSNQGLTLTETASQLEQSSQLPSIVITQSVVIIQSSALPPSASLSEPPLQQSMVSTVNMEPPSSHPPLPLPSLTPVPVLSSPRAGLNQSLIDFDDCLSSTIRPNVNPGRIEHDASPIRSPLAKRRKLSVSSSDPHQVRFDILVLTHTARVKFLLCLRSVNKIKRVQRHWQMCTLSLLTYPFGTTSLRDKLENQNVCVVLRSSLWKSQLSCTFVDTRFALNAK